MNTQMKTGGAAERLPRRRSTLNSAGLEANGSGAKGKLRAAAHAAKSAALPREHGRDALTSLSEALSRDLACDYLEAKVAGSATRCPITPIASTAIVHDKMRVNLTHSKNIYNSSGGDDTNISITMPHLDRVFLTTASDHYEVVYDTADDLGQGITTRFRGPSNGGNQWNATSDIGFFAGNADRAIFPLVTRDGVTGGTGYQVFDNAFNATISIGGTPVTQFGIYGEVYVEPTVDSGGFDGWNLNYAVMTATGVILSTGVVTLTASLFPDRFAAGEVAKFIAADNLYAYNPATSTAEVIVFWLSNAEGDSDVEIKGYLNFSIDFYNAANTPGLLWRVPKLARLLTTHSASTYEEVDMDQYAMRTLASLFTFDGPLLAQGGFIAMTEVKARERITRTDLVDWAGSRPQSHYGKIIAGAFGWWAESRPEDFEYKSPCQPYDGDSKYLFCASTITDPSQQLNLVAITDFGYEFLTNSLLYEQSMAVPATYPQLMFLVMSSMPRFSSNDDHDQTILNKARRIKVEAAKASSGQSTPWWKRLLNTLGKVGKAVLPVLPSIIAAL